MIGFVSALMVKSKVNVRGKLEKVNPSVCPVQRSHSMSKDDRATSARRKRRKDPVADRAERVVNPSW